MVVLYVDGEEDIVNFKPRFAEPRNDTYHISLQLWLNLPRFPLKAQLFKLRPLVEEIGLEVRICGCGPPHGRVGPTVLLVTNVIPYYIHLLYNGDKNINVLYSSNL